MRTEKWLSKKIRKEFRVAFVYSFEEARVYSVPDLHAVYPGGSFWIELKQVPNVNTALPFRDGQVQWLSNYARRGGCAFVLAIVQDLNELWLWEAAHARRLECRKIVETVNLLANRFDLSSPRVLEAIETHLILDPRNK